MYKISLLHAISGRKRENGLAADKQRPSNQAAQQQSQQQSTSLSSVLEPRDWSIQAATVTNGLLDVSRYKSLAVYAEVKLAEALEKAASASSDAVDEDGEVLPNSLKTAVCCQLLGELAELCGPFSGTLLKLRDELLPALYSSYAAAQTGKALQFDQMPWFMVANQLQCQNQLLLGQQEAFKAELNKHQAQMLDVEQQLLAFKAAMDAGEVAAAELQLTNARLVAARDSAGEEAAVAVDESKRLAAEVTRLKDELGGMQEALDNAKEVAIQDMQQWQGQLEALKKQLHVEKQERESAVALAAARLTLHEGQELELRCQEAERRLEEAEQRLAAVKSENSPDPQQLQLLTPRPTEWGAAQPLADACKATSETVRQLLQQQAATVEALQRSLHLQQALAQPDPAPAAFELSLKTETSKYFITEGVLDIDMYSNTSAKAPDSHHGSGRPKMLAEALGLGHNVPAFLRWDAAVQLQDTSIQQLQQQISSIWQQKAEFEELHGPCHLQTYLHHHFTAQVAATVGMLNTASVPCSQAAAAAEGEGAGFNSASDRSSEAASSTPIAAAASDEAVQLTAAIQAAAAAGYQLCYALSTHRQNSVAADTMWQVLTGQLPESVLQEQQQEVQGLLRLLQELSDASSGGSAVRSPIKSSAGLGSASQLPQTAGLAASDLSTVLRLLYPLKQPQQLAELAGCLEAACNCFSSGRSCSSAVSSNSGMSLQNMAAVAAAMQQQASTLVACSPRCVDQQLIAQQEASNSSSTRSTVSEAAVHQLLECLARQHLHGSLVHTQQTVLQVQQLLIEANPTSRNTYNSRHSVSGIAAAEQACAVQLLPPAASPVWHQVSLLLRQHTDCSTNDSCSCNALFGSSQGSMPGRQGTAEGSRRLLSSTSGRYNPGMGVTGVQEMSLVAAAVAGHGRANSIGNDSRKVRADSAEDMSSEHGGKCTGCELLLAMQRIPPGKMEVQQFLQWLQRHCLLAPPSCRKNVAAALQWCKSMQKGNAAAGDCGGEDSDE